MDRHERRRARGVQRHAWSVQAQHVGQPACRGVQRRARSSITVELVKPDFAQDPSVIHAGDADEHTGRAAGVLLARNCRIFQGLPGGFKQQPLLRIHRNGFARRNREKVGIEARYIRQHGSFAEACRSRVRFAGAVVRGHGPAIDRPNRIAS